MNRTPVADNRARGFTLIELMVVVAIVAIVSAAVVPSFSLSLRKNRQREAGMLIIEAVFTARSRAVRTGRCHRVRVMLSDTANDGGFGGAVAIDESTTNTCNTAAPEPCIVALGANLWTRVSYKSVWTSMEIADDIQADAQGDNHVGLIGEDVAIFEVTDRAGAVIVRDPMLFDSIGRLVDRIERYYDIVGGPVTRQVRVTAGGSVRYTLR
jgi:prepilin-type N-terminal cleavage/methylation domain-containing protein